MIASISCFCTPPAKERREIVIGIFCPEPHEKYEYSCKVNLPDKDEPYEIYGVDSLQALALAMRFASTRIDHFLSLGWKFQWQSDSDSLMIDILWHGYFMPQTVLDKLATIGEEGTKFYSDNSSK